LQLESQIDSQRAVGFANKPQDRGNK